MVARPTPSDAIVALIENELADVHTAFPCQVVEYRAAEQTVDLQPVVRTWADYPDGTVEWTDRPVLQNIPVAFMRGGGFHCSLPLQAGDFMLVVCSELDTLIWRDTGETSNAGVQDRHQLNGCFAIPCGYPDTAKLDPPPDGAKMVLASDNGNTRFELDDAGNIAILGNVSIDGNVTTTGSYAVDGDVVAKGEVTALDGPTAVNLSTHTHPSGTGPTGPPTPGS